MGDRYPELREEDLIYEKGKEDDLLSHLQEKLNKPRTEVKRE